MNLKKLGKLDQEPWKAPLPQFIEDLYEKRFGRARPTVVMPIEERGRAQDAKKAARKEARRHYSWGNFKGDEDAWMAKYFDAFLYLADWGTHVVKLRLPTRLLDAKTARL